MGLPIFQVDAFAEQAFQGNPAAVCLLDNEAEADWMQNVAVEMNLSETAFVVRHDKQQFGLRWFTPGMEVILCGHATLASAHTIWEQGLVDRHEQLAFETKSGTLTATCDADGTIQLDFPRRFVQPTETPKATFEALGITKPVFVGKDVEDYLVRVSSESEVRALQPDFSSLARVGGIRGVIVTAPGDSEFDFVSRCFYPAAGINEDPVTGSAIAAWQITGNESLIRQPYGPTKRLHVVASLS